MDATEGLSIVSNVTTVLSVLLLLLFFSVVVHTNDDDDDDTDCTIGFSSFVVVVAVGTKGASGSFVK